MKNFLRKNGAARLAVFLPILILFIAGCGHTQTTSSQKTVAVSVGKVQTKTMPIQLDAVGNVQAYNSVTIIPQVTGRVAGINFRQGQYVKAGELLVTIDPAPFEQQLAQAEAQLNHDRAQAKYNQITANRYLDLYKRDAVSLQDYDQMATSARTQDATVQQSEAAVNSARINLRDCYIKSPINGRTGAFLANLGSMATANQTQLVVINQIQPIFVQFTIPEKYLAEVVAARRKGPLQVTANISDQGVSVTDGVLTFIDNTVDPASGVVRMKAQFPNPTRQLWPGQFIRVILTLGDQQNAVVVPSAAVMDGQNGKYVFVVKKDNTVEARQVTEERELGKLAVIGKGLVPGETVVTDGQVNLSSGDKVSIKAPVPQQSPGTSTQSNTQGGAAQ
jgi:multidrug efflux system membrane fusion protein